MSKELKTIVVAMVLCCAAFICCIAESEKRSRELTLEIEAQRLELESAAIEKANEEKALAEQADREAYYAEKKKLDAEIREINNIGATITVISYDDYHKLVGAGETFLLEVSRVTCPYCMNLSYMIKDMDTHGVDVYVLDLEEIRGTDRYDEIKAEFGINYVPTLFFVEEGEIKYCLNSPLTENMAQISKPEEREAVMEIVVQKVEDFILGAIGEGTLINEEPLKKEE